MNPLTSTIARCEAAHTMVSTNQAQWQCALEHACPPGRECPLAGCFADTHAAERGLATGEVAAKSLGKDGR